MVDRETVIIGSGIAGLSAAVYTGRSGIDTLVIRGDEPGGQLTLTSEVENYPGFEDGINGTELVSNIEGQAEKFGVDFCHGIVEQICRETPNSFKILFSQKESITTESIIIASGASARTLDIPGEDVLMGHGVSTCATCDGAFFRGEGMAVVGGGDAAFEEAHFLTKFADTVYLIHRREQFRAEKYWQDKVQEKVDAGEIEILQNTEVTEINGSKQEGVSSVELISHPDGYPKKKQKNGVPISQSSLSVGAVFIAIGHEPNTDFLENMPIKTDDAGYIVTDAGRGGGQTRTQVPGVFAAGDVVDYHYQQAATAAGMGVKAALDVDEYLTEKQND